MDILRRGDFVTIAVQGDYGKPRPALVIQANQFSNHESITVLQLSGTYQDAPFIRISIEPNANNGLRKPCQIMVDRAMTLKRNKIGKPFGHIEPDTMLKVNHALAVFLGIV